MGKYLCVVCLVACASSSVLKAQGYLATVGVPYSYDYAAAIGITELPSILPDGFTFTYSFSGGSNLPPGLTVSSSGLISGIPTQAGEFLFTLNFNFTESYMGYSASDSVPLEGVVVVQGNSGPPVAAVPGALTFSLTKGSSTGGSQSIVITNQGSTPQTFTVTAVTDSGVNWLSVSPSSGVVAPFSSTSVAVNANAGSLNEGTYLGTVSGSVSPANQPISVAVTATVSGGEPELRISQSGVYFQTVAGGGTPTSESITVLNAGSGTLSFSVSTSTAWLSASPSSGSVTSTSSASVTISINPTGLAAGDYYGQVQIAASGVVNSPQTVSVVLKVAAAGTDLGASVYPTGLIFVAQANGANPAAQTVSLTNPSATPLNFAAAPLFGQGASSLTVQPASGAVSAASPVQITVQPIISGLAVGAYFGEVGLQVSDKKTRHVAVVLIVVPGPVPANTFSAAASPHAAASTCTPTKLIPVFTQLGVGFSTVAAWPTPIAATIVDDCGNLLTVGSVVASFSNGDSALPLTSLNNGSWSATWQPQNSAAQVTITVQAQEAAPPLQGTQSIGGTLQDNPTTPAILGVVSAVDFVK